MLLSLNLLLKATYLLFNLGLVGAQKLLHRVCFDWLLPEGQMCLQVSHLRLLESRLGSLLLPLRCEEVKDLIKGSVDADVRAIEVRVLFEAVFKEGYLCSERAHLLPQGFNLDPVSIHESIRVDQGRYRVLMLLLH